MGFIDALQVHYESYHLIVNTQQFLSLILSLVLALLSTFLSA